MLKARVVGVSLAIVAILITTVAVSRPGAPAVEAQGVGGSVELIPQSEGGSQFVYVVFHTLDRDGFCSVPPGAVSLHPVLGIPVDFVIESGDGIIVETNSGRGTYGRAASSVTFSTKLNAAAGSPVRAFPPAVAGTEDECQAWVRISQSIPGPLRVLVTVTGPDGRAIGFIADASRSGEASDTLALTAGWNLVVWQGRDGIRAAEAVPDGRNISAVYAWDAAAQDWLAYFPGTGDVPGANDLRTLTKGQPYWIAAGPGATLSWAAQRAD